MHQHDRHLWIAVEDTAQVVEVLGPVVESSKPVWTTNGRTEPGQSLEKRLELPAEDLEPLGVGMDLYSGEAQLCQAVLGHLGLARGFHVHGSRTAPA